MTTIAANRSVLMSRIALFLSGAILCFAGVSGTLDPTMLSGDSVLAPDGVTSVRVDYGGFHLGLGLFALLGALKISLLRPGLIAATITLTLVVVARGVGMQIDGVTEAQIFILTIEAIPFGLAVFGLIVLLRSSGMSTAEPESI